MRIAVRIEDALLKQAKLVAEARGETLSQLIGRGLRLVLEPSAPRARVKLPVSHSRGGVLPGIDLDNSADLLDRMEDRYPVKPRRGRSSLS